MKTQVREHTQLAAAALMVAAILLGGCGALNESGVLSGTSAARAQAAPQTYSSPTFGYAVDLPTNFRRSLKLSTVISGDLIFLGHDVFTARSATDEDAQLANNSEWLGPAWHWTVIVVAHNNPEALTALEWANSVHAGWRTGQVLETLTLAGQTAVRITGGARFPVQYFISYKGIMYLVAYNTGATAVAGADENGLKTVVASFRLTR